ncbi:hypothetical protein TNCV_3334991 [Trichonephila clavipes]|nr:hypothetical protein TNCV_3334991 [Trichonephila clavipes]
MKEKEQLNHVSTNSTLNSKFKQEQLINFILPTVERRLSERQLSGASNIRTGFLLIEKAKKTTMTTKGMRLPTLSNRSQDFKNAMKI